MFENKFKGNPSFQALQPALYNESIEVLNGILSKIKIR